MSSNDAPKDISATGFINHPAPHVEILRQLAMEPDPVAPAFTRCGRSLQKHGYRPSGSVYPRIAGPPARYNALAKRIVEDIFDSPGTIVRDKPRVRHREMVSFIEVVAANGQKLGYGWNALTGQYEFEGFREPEVRPN